MMDLSRITPGHYFQAHRPAPQEDNLRTDVTGFIGPTSRGPIGRATFVAGWRHYQSIYGSETREYDTSYSIRGYFNNGGELAYVYRVLGKPHETASVEWRVGELDMAQQWQADAPAGGGFVSARYRIIATSPGAWVNGMQIFIRYQLHGINEQPQVDIEVRPDNEAGEFLTGLSPADIVNQVQQRSQLIRLEIIAGYTPQATAHDGPLSIVWGPLEMLAVTETAPELDDYMQASNRLLEQLEIGLVALPDLDRLQNSAHVDRIVISLATRVDPLLDRQVLVSPPKNLKQASELQQWSSLKRSQLSGEIARNVAVYHPWIRVNDPLGSISQPLRTITPVGHIAGLISRLDRERGAHHTPANAVLSDTVDVDVHFNLLAQGNLVQSGINPIRCKKARGLEVWGGRTLADPSLAYGNLYIAHRRLLHLLVRACRRVAKPLVFDNNVSLLRLAIVRALTSVLLEAYRAGALKGERPEQAFRIKCDEENNTQQTIDMGQVNCLIQVAPAVPMEFITMRISLSGDGKLEVAEQ